MPGERGVLHPDHEEILQAIPAMARGCGVFAEPVGAASLAGLVRAVHSGLVTPDERIVVLATGSGLKDIRGPCVRWGNHGVSSPA